MKRITFIAIIFFAAIISYGQSGDLIIKSDDGKLHLEHKVAPRESFFALGRKYNVSAKFLAAYNKLDINKGLKLDQKLKVPLTDTNFLQTGNTGAPVYYKVCDKEGLSTVSKKNNGVKLANLRSWNQINGDIIKKDAKLIVGFLVGSEFKPLTLPVFVDPTELPPPPEQKNVVTEIEPIKPPVKEIVKETPVVKEVPVVKEEKPVVKPQQETTPASEGHFKTDFEKQIRLTPVSVNETVTSGIFKTTSGWQDFKYYLLIDKAVPGTIVKIVNPTNNKAVYAKVLGEMSGIRQNAGLNIRISNAASSALGISEDDKFVLKISY